TGQLLFGLGAETMINATLAALGIWFGGRGVALAMALNISFARLGSYAADLSPTYAAGLYERGWQPPLWFAAVIIAIGLVAAAACWWTDARAGRSLPAHYGAERFNWADIWRFNRSFWYLVALCVLFYSVIFPFRSTFAIEYFQNAHGLPLDAAGLMNSYVFLA